MAKEIYYCYNCNSTWGGSTFVNKCPDCKNLLRPMKYTVDQWHLMSDKEKRSAREMMHAEIENQEKEKFERENAIKTIVREQATLRLNHDEIALKLNDIYEYDIDVIYDEKTGGVDVLALRASLVDHASKGWRLVSTVNNELGVNSNGMSYMGMSSSTNATVDQTILVYERLIEKKEK